MISSSEVSLQTDSSSLLIGFMDIQHKISTEEKNQSFICNAVLYKNTPLLKGDDTVVHLYTWIPMGMSTTGIAQVVTKIKQKTHKTKKTQHLLSLLQDKA